LRIEAYGTVDELNSWIGLIRDQEMATSNKELLLEIQDRLFTIGSLLASDPDKSKMKLPVLHQQDIDLLEQEMDKMEENLPPLKSFILPGGHSTVSYIHIARCVCRRTERLVVHLSDDNVIDSKISIYLNRLSDFLFMLGRFMAKELNVPETPWNARM
jgi:cob(I)alamin adenosyltransferase